MSTATKQSVLTRMDFTAADTAEIHPIRVFLFFYTVGIVSLENHLKLGR